MQPHQDIGAVLRTYFDGLYRGDVELLKSVFHPDALLFGEVRDAPYQNTLDGFLNAVASRRSPQQRGEEFAMEATDIQLLNRIAYVRARCPMLGYDYFDYLALVHDGERWLITNQVITHVDS
jgi:hypothetical protein